MAFMESLIGFLVSLLVSTIIIYVVGKVLGEHEGVGTAIMAAFIGAIIFALAAYFIGVGWIAALVGGVAWLIALGSLYSIGWLKSLAIAAVIWVFATLVSIVLPTIGGPL